MTHHYDATGEVLASLSSGVKFRQTTIEAMQTGTAKLVTGLSPAHQLADGLSRILPSKRHGFTLS